MKIQGLAALVTGGGSGLGAETARELARQGARVAVLDVNAAAAQAVAAEIGGLGLTCDITNADSVSHAMAAAREAHGPARVLMNVAGIGGGKRVVGKDGNAVPLAHFQRIIDVNLVGTFNMIRLVAAEFAKLDPLNEDGERGVIVNTASVAAYDGQIGQAAYAASKGGLVGLTLPLARDLAQHGVRVVTIAPGLFKTPLINELSPEAQRSLAESVPFPRRLGNPTEFAALAAHIVTNAALNGEVIRLDGALRMAPR
jgi:NAD(P)-dependent dehydrogenase (short-subunit alcohol dehydrogenase family)